MPKPPTLHKASPSLDESVTAPKTSIRRLRFGLVAQLSLLVLGIALTAGLAPQYLKASDHDDGEVDTKERNLNLTDLFVFRGKDQNPNASASDLIFIMNTTPLSVALQQYYFSTKARYEFKVSRTNNNDATPTGVPDVTLRFEFDKPNAKGQQGIKLTTI